MIEPTIVYEGVTYAPIQSQENTPLVPVIPVTAQPLIIQQKKTTNKANKIGQQIILLFCAMGQLAGLGCLVASPIVWNSDLAIGGAIAFVVCSCFGCPVAIASCKKKK